MSGEPTRFEKLLIIAALAVAGWVIVIVVLWRFWQLLRLVFG